jgi:GT2 family glycosyltransferase
MIYKTMPEDYRKTLVQELIAQENSPIAGKDILIVVHNQADLVFNLLNSVFCCTIKPFKVYLWDNASDDTTKECLRKFETETFFSKENRGFIEPNNFMAAQGSQPYIILLNSDTEVKPGWDQALTGFLSTHSDFGIAGYQGGVLNSEGIGTEFAWGERVDYVSGWCMCFSRSLYNKIGLFDDKNLSFAYGEDSDFCLRAKEHGFSSYALHLDYVRHIGGATIKTMGQPDHLVESFKKNHEYIKKRWK